MIDSQIKAEPADPIENEDPDTTDPSDDNDGEVSKIKVLDAKILRDNAGILVIGLHLSEKADGKIISEYYDNKSELITRHELVTKSEYFYNETNVRTGIDFDNLKEIKVYFKDELGLNSNVISLDPQDFLDIINK